MLVKMATDNKVGKHITFVCEIEQHRCYQNPSLHDSARALGPTSIPLSFAFVKCCTFSCQVSSIRRICLVMLVMDTSGRVLNDIAKMTIYAEDT